MHLGYPEQQRHVAGDDYDVEEYRADDSAVDIELGITNKDEIAKNLTDRSNNDGFDGDIRPADSLEHIGGRGRYGDYACGKAVSRHYRGDNRDSV